MLKKLMLAGAGLVLSVPAFAHHGWGGHARHYYNYPPRVVYQPRPVVYKPVPVPVYYRPAPVYYAAPPRVVYAPAPAPVYAAPVPSSFFSIRLDFPF